MGFSDIFFKNKGLKLSVMEVSYPVIANYIIDNFLLNYIDGFTKLH